MAKRDGKAAKRYARALFNLSVPDRLDAMRAALVCFCEVWSQDASLRQVMSNPAVSLQDRLSLIQMAASQVAPGDNTFSNLLGVLLTNGRLSDIDSLRLAYEQIVAEFKKTLTLQITSAFELPQQERDDIVREIQARIPAGYASLIEVAWRVDNKALGGLSIKAGDKILDGSLAGVLERLVRELRV